MRLLPILLLVAAVALGLALNRFAANRAGGASIDPHPSAAVPGVPQGHVFTGIAEEPDDVNPFTAHGAMARRLVLAYTHDTLLDRDPRTGALRPALAESFEPAADGTSCTFTLRAGVRFADGSPLGLDDVLFGWELARAGHLPLGSVAAAFSRVASVEVLDERRFTVHFAQRHFAAVEAVGVSWLVAKKDWFVARVRRLLDPGEALPAIDSARFAALVDRIDGECGPGTGPYELHNEPGGRSTWLPRQHLQLVRSEHCWRRAVAGTWNFAGVRTLFRDEAGATNALLRGEVDWMSSSAVAALSAAHPSLNQRYRRLVYDYPMLGLYRIVWNCRRAPCDDPRVRRALGMLVDHDGLVAVFDGAARPAAAHASRGRPEYPDLQLLPYAPAAARGLLREIGYDPAAGRPLRIVLLALQGTATLRRTVELLVAAARAASIELEVRSCETMAAMVAQRERLDWDGLLVWQTFNPWGDPYDLLHSAGLDNDGAWRHPEADALVSAARTELDADRRAALWRRLHELVYAEQPVAFLVHPLASVLLSVHVRNAEPGPFGLIPERAWVEPAFQRQ